MSTFTFQKAVKIQEKLRLALDGPPGSGKTWTSLTIGTFLAGKDGGRIAVIDSERSSAKKYASDFDFDHLTLPDNDPHTYTEAIRAAVEAKYAVIIVDSLSHAWEGTLDLKDRVQKRSKSNDGFGAWREVTPVHDELVDTMLRAPAHVIATMRTKMEYLVEKNEATGKNSVSKIGLKSVQRDGVDYEFDIVGDMDQENTLTISKTRCSTLAGAVVRRPGEDVAKIMWDWLEDGDPVVSPQQADQLRAIFKAVTDDEERIRAQRVFAASYAKPAEVPLSQFDEALAFAFSITRGPDDEWEVPAAQNANTGGAAADAAGSAGDATSSGDGADGQDVGQPAAEATPPTPDEAAQAPEPERHPPGTKPTDEDASALLAALAALPEEARELCKKDLQRTFGRASEMNADETRAAIAIARDWPVTSNRPQPRPRRTAKHSSLLAYGRSRRLDERQLCALVSFLAGTLEPLPVESLDAGGIDSVTSLVDDAAAGRIVFEETNGLLVAKEVTAA